MSHPKHFIFQSMHIFLYLFTISKFLSAMFYRIWYLTLQFSSVTQSCPTLCDPTDCSMPGLLIHHQLPEFTQTHVHWVGDAIQPSHPVSSLFLLPSIFPSIRVFSNESAPRIRWPMNTQDWSPLGWTGWISLQSKGLSRVFSNTTVQKHRFFCAQLSL